MLDEEDIGADFNSSLAGSVDTGNGSSSSTFSVAQSQPSESTKTSKIGNGKRNGKNIVSEVAARAQRKISTALSSDAHSASSTSDDGEEWQDRPSSPDLPPKYWQVQRLIKYIKVGNSNIFTINEISRASWV